MDAMQVSSTDRLKRNPNSSHLDHHSRPGHCLPHHSPRRGRPVAYSPHKRAPTGFLSPICTHPHFYPPSLPSTLTVSPRPHPHPHPHSPSLPSALTLTPNHPHLSARTSSPRSANPNHTHARPPPGLQTLILTLYVSLVVVRCVHCPCMTRYASMMSGAPIGATTCSVA